MIVVLIETGRAPVTIRLPLHAASAFEVAALGLVPGLGDEMGEFAARHVVFRHRQRIVNAHTVAVFVGQAELLALGRSHGEFAGRHHGHHRRERCVPDLCGSVSGRENERWFVKVASRRRGQCLHRQHREGLGHPPVIARQRHLDDVRKSARRLVLATQLQEALTKREAGLGIERFLLQHLPVEDLGVSAQVVLNQIVRPRDGLFEQGAFKVGQVSGQRERFLLASCMILASSGQARCDKFFGASLDRGNIWLAALLQPSRMLRLAGLQPIRIRSGHGLSSPDKHADCQPGRKAPPQYRAHMFG